MWGPCMSERRKKGRKVRKATAAAIILAVLLSFASMASAHIDAFGSGDAGWGTSLIDNTGYSWSRSPTYSPSGGDPGGCLSASVGASADGRLYSFDAPASPLGDLTGQTLTVDIKVTGTGAASAIRLGASRGAVGYRPLVTTGVGSAMARLYIGKDSSNYFVSANACSLSLSSSGGWITYTVPVNAADFFAWPVVRRARRLSRMSPPTPSGSAWFLRAPIFLPPTIASAAWG